jgi:ribosomal protein S21
MEVYVHNDDIDRALILFKRGCIPILREVRDRRGYLKPSEKLKRMQGRHERYNERPANL